MNSISNKLLSGPGKSQVRNRGFSLPLSGIDSTRIEIDFNGGALSSDAGVLLLRETERQMGILDQITGCIADERDQRYVTQSVKAMLSQRVYQIACGWEDGNDCDHLREDPIFKMAADRRPKTGAPLASQPTMSRFENSISVKELYRIAETFVHTFIAGYDKAPKVIVLDFDDTVDPVHGQQQLSLFNGYYGEYCYCPLHVYEGLSGKFITALLKPGKRSSGQQSLAILKRLVNKLRQVWPKTLLVFRADGHFSSPVIHQWIEGQKNVYFITGLTSNAVLRERCKGVRERAKRLYQEQHQPVKLYHSFYYQANSWEQAYRIVAKIERGDRGENIRFVVTNMYLAKTRMVYEYIYCRRGNMENMIKEHKVYLKSDRTSCHRFAANQFRLFIHSAAYVLLHALRSHVLKHTQFARASFETLRVKLLKIGAQVQEMRTRIKVQLPESYPHKEVIERCSGIFALLAKT
ncbi:MAG: IS1380 family transposase [bacterium]|nr:MAG: IS1380 family transposase [bacterium]